MVKSTGVGTFERTEFHATRKRKSRKLDIGTVAGFVGLALACAILAAMV